MQEKGKPFKKPSKKHQPKGLKFIYEDRDILVVDKTSGLLTISTEKEKEKTAYFLLTDYVRKGNSRSKNRIFIVHRLDKDTSGIIVFAKTIQAKRYLQDNWQDFNKKYLAIVNGQLEEKEGMISAFLQENKARSMHSVDDSNKGKFSKTSYKVLKESKNYSLLEIVLLTGKKHQIRVHFADKGHPVVGDRKYGIKEKGIRRLGLHAASLEILHPFSKEKMLFETEFPPYFKTLVNY